MYKIIVVDDEEIVRRSIVMKLKWEEIGFDIPYQASNGLEAFELALKVKPDLVFSDIKMPIMDGLELAGKLKETLPDTHVVIFSGHDEFVYAKESITLGVIDYILKPLGSVTLTKKFIELKKQLDIEYEKKSYLQKMKDQLSKSLPLLKESFLYGLVCSPNSDIYSHKRMQSIDMNLGDGPYCVGIVEPIFNPIDIEFIDVFLFSMKNIVLESLGDKHPYFVDATGKLVIVFCFDTLHPKFYDRDLFINMLQVIQKAFVLHLKLQTTIGLGNMVTNLDDLFTSYSNGLTALECKYNMGIGKIYDITDLSDIKTEFYYPLENSQKFIAAVKANNRSDIRDTIKSIHNLIATKKNLTLSNLKFIFIELVTGLTRILAESKNYSTELWSETLALYKTIEEYRSIDFITKDLIDISFKISDSLSEISSSSRKNMVRNATIYVKDHYGDETISLKTTADHVSVSSGYLSAIFKAENGVNFNTYLTQIRIEEAKRLLATTDKTVYDIAYETGYSNPHYFSISFKKYTNTSPSDYRAKIRMR